MGEKSLFLERIKAERYIKENLYLTSNELIAEILLKMKSEVAKNEFKRMA